MCWQDENEPYNSGRAFKITCRDQRGVIVTIMADNYYGYCKKEVKTQISYAANLFGLCEEEHAGGAIAYPAYILGQDFYADRTVSSEESSFRGRPCKILGDLVEQARKASPSTAAIRTSSTFPKTPISSSRDGHVALAHEGQLSA